MGGGQRKVLKVCQKSEFYFETLCKYLLFTMYLTSTNMPTAQQKKRAQIGVSEILVLSSRLF